MVLVSIMVKVCQIPPRLQLTIKKPTILKHTKLLKTKDFGISEKWGTQWSSGWRAGLPIDRFEVQIPARAEIWFETSAPPVPPSQLSYDEYTDCTLSVERWDGKGDDWPPAINKKVLTHFTPPFQSVSAQENLTIKALDIWHQLIVHGFIFDKCQQ